MKSKFALEIALTTIDSYSKFLYAELIRKARGEDVDEEHNINLMLLESAKRMIKLGVAMEKDEETFNEE